MIKPKIIVHGGAWDIPAHMHKMHTDGIEKALRKGIEILQKTNDPIETVIGIVCALEDDPTFDAGKGSFLNEAGQVEMDAGIMHGKDLSVGAVAAIQNIRNPIIIANLVREKTQHVMLTGEGALMFAKEQGVQPVDTIELLVGREKELYHDLLKEKDVKIKSFFEMKHPSDTVGAVVINSHGNIAAATSTGGTPFKKAGRVGDSPIVGAGFYADDTCAGVSTTGWGEGILRTLLAREAADQVLNGTSAHDAAKKSIAIMKKKVNGDAGLIIIDKTGDYAFDHNTPFMAVGAATIDAIDFVKISSR